eukprot:14967112-Alexandrium_andersonii.AAC.1
MGAECPGGPLGHPQARGSARSRNQSSERAKAEGCPEVGDWTRHSPGAGARRVFHPKPVAPHGR